MSKISVDELKQCFEDALAKSIKKELIPKAFSSKRLSPAMAYALSSFGKRLRPVLVLATAMAQSEESDASIAIKLAMPAALAVEYVHTYSLIHDDLPAMDDDDYRRNRLSVHRQFNEAEAILAGDALLADAFYWISMAKYNSAPQCRELALATGRHGLPAGQAEDLLLQKNSSADVLLVNQIKTGRLFEASCALGALSTGAALPATASWRRFGCAFGAAFQLKDDLDDAAGAYLSHSKPQIAELMRENLWQCEDFLKSQNRGETLLELLHLTFASALSLGS